MSLTTEVTKTKILRLEKKRLVLILNSHSLSDYQKCPRLYEYTGIHKIEPATARQVFTRGTAISRMLEEYYNARIEHKPKLDCLEAGLVALRAAPIEQDLKDFIELRFMAYIKTYHNEGYVPLATEKRCAFSKVLYEDSKVVFIYEGCPDLLCNTPGNSPRRVTFDHKSTERIDKIFELNNQSIGYSWACESEFFIYNYFGLQEKYDPKTNFRRVPVTITSKIIGPWLKSTRNWYYKILWSEINYKKYQDKEGYHLDPSWQCEGKYGKCWFTSLCECSSDTVMLDKIRREFKINEYKSW